MAKAGRFLRSYKSSRYSGYAHWCPACDEAHVFAVDAPNGSGARWTFNEDLARPSFQPSMLIRTNPPGDPHYQPRALSSVCHYFLIDGEMRYLNDCTHALKGKTVPLPEWPAGLRTEEETMNDETAKNEDKAKESQTGSFTGSVAPGVGPAADAPGGTGAPPPDHAAGNVGEVGALEALRGLVQGLSERVDAIEEGLKARNEMLDAFVKEGREAFAEAKASSSMEIAAQVNQLSQQVTALQAKLKHF